MASSGRPRPGIGADPIGVMMSGASQEIDPEFLRSVLAASADCIKVLDLDANLVFMTEAGQRIMEVSDFNAIRGCPWPDFWRDQGHVDAKAAVAAARAGGVGHFQGRASTMAGTPRWWDVQVTPIRGPDGRPEKLLSVSRDITAQKLAEERQELLMQELAHRVKNTLALVQAIAAQTMRGAASLKEARDAFTARLVALSQAHDLLIRDSWTDASLSALVEGVARLHADGNADQFSFGGPDVRLGPKAALSLALALHELATNAAKYGALSVAAGRVDVSWRVSSDPVPRLAFTWREVGGPTVVPPSRTGFGSKLIERTLASSLAANVALAYPPDGFILTVEGPLSAMREA